MNLDYEWQRPYVSAVLETDRARLSERIQEAHAAIDARANELNQDHQGTPDERLAIEFALNCLKLLSQEIPAPKQHSSGVSANR